MKKGNAFYNTLLDKVKQNTFKDLFVHNNEEVSSFNEKLKKFIELQKNNDEIDLSYIYFKEDIKTTFLQYINDKKISFANSIFETKAYFTEFEFGDTANFEGAKFNGIANFNRVVFKKDCSFENVYFKKEVEFKKTEFTSNAKFSSSRFKKFASFEGAIFNKDADFENSIAEDLFYFHNIKLGKLNLIGSHFDKANFLRLHNNSNSDNIVLTKKNFANKDTARILKSHFDKENNIIETNIYFVIEQEFFIDLLRKKESKYPNRYLNLITVNFNKYISNYGTDWGRPLFVLFGLGYFFILLYSFLNDYNINDYRYIMIKSADYKWIICGMITSLLSYFLYTSNYKITKLLLIIVMLYFIQAIFFYTELRELNNNIVTLLNPLNIFNQDLYYAYKTDSIYKEYLVNINHFEKIALYGVIVKFITVLIFYHFIMALRNSTRRKS